MRGHQADAETLGEVLDAHRALGHDGLGNHPAARQLARVAAVGGHLIPGKGPQRLLGPNLAICHPSLSCRCHSHIWRR
ncbi:hypothetical protein ACVOMV_19570 [Mesorhizobium atlanticum]